MNRFWLWTAQGAGLGRIPVAPGTFGSLAGLLWFALLLCTGEFWCVAALSLAALPLCAWICGQAAQILRDRDPPSVVLDEIVAVPICYLAWVGIVAAKTGGCPGPKYFLSEQTWLLTVAVFAAFRFFDVVKPWPVYQSQSLRHGWGITIDDALAAVYANGVVLAAYAGKAMLAR